MKVDQKQKLKLKISNALFENCLPGRQHLWLVLNNLLFQIFFPLIKNTSHHMFILDNKYWSIDKF